MATAKTNALLSVIGDEDTVTGMLLAGVGNVDARAKKNFFVVDSSARFILPSIDQSSLCCP